MSENATGQPDPQTALPQTALPQTTEWSNTPTDEVGLTDDQAPLDEGDDVEDAVGQLSENNFSGGESSPPGTPDEPPAQNKAENDSARQYEDQSAPAFGESVEDL